MRQMWRVGHAKFFLRDWIPLAGGVTLLVFLGLSGAKTDILGHILGFGFGIAVGWPAGDPCRVLHAAAAKADQLIRLLFLIIR